MQPTQKIPWMPAKCLELYDCGRNPQNMRSSPTKYALESQEMMFFSAFLAPQRQSHTVRYDFKRPIITGLIFSLVTIAWALVIAWALYISFLASKSSQSYRFRHHHRHIKVEADQNFKRNISSLEYCRTSWILCTTFLGIWFPVRFKHFVEPHHHTLN